MIGDYFNNDGFKQQFCEWLNQTWQEKDKKLEEILLFEPADRPSA